ncbi:hypothetical protein BDP27DRAFT_1325475 [Rhodocollybia butyracea]|uniref:Uncharacterized protein n=1 Tax=Rhodocollybia butyracea TaxID=206335 RepID=A0A9P5PUE7_9AGAR|nr:hypothetical protein BDP27DRAFT_1325475 [Rhodocollybia butyracea]
MLITLVPCLRSAFDAAATLVLLYKLWTHAREIEKALGSDHSSRFYDTLITEGVQPPDSSYIRLTK